jgi:hypothetical protein
MSVGRIVCSCLQRLQAFMWQLTVCFRADGQAGVLAGEFAGGLQERLQETLQECLTCRCTLPPRQTAWHPRNGHCNAHSNT